MMNKNTFTIGYDKYGANYFHANLSKLIDTRLLIQANSGGGKSYAVRRLLEQTHGKVQQLVIDPEGEYASLREKFDYVLAAKDGETPADPRSAKLLATRLLELKASAILDIYELKHRDRLIFVRDFLDTLVNSPKHLWHSVLIVIDEAHIFCPQAKDDEESSSAAAVKDMCTRGRKRGFCAVLATQRLSKLHKDAAAECNNKLIGRSSMDVDMKRAAEELGFGSKEQMLSLRKLKPGDFYAFGPAISDEVVQVHVGAVTTRHPKAGSRRHFKAPPPTKHIMALLPKLADLPAEVDEHEQTMAELRRQVAHLRVELRDAKRQQPTPKPTTVEVPILTAKQVKKIERLVPKIRAATASGVVVATKYATLRDQFESAVRELVTSILSAKMNNERMSGGSPTHIESTLNTHRIHTVPYSPPDARSAVVASENGHIPKGQRKTLVAIAQHADGVTREQVSVLTAFKRSTRDQYLQWLVSRGFVALNGSGIAKATEAGVRILGSDYQILPTGDALLQHWLGRLPSGQRDVLAVVAKQYPSVVSREEISDATKFARSTRDQYLQALSRARLLINHGDRFKASDSLFG